MTLADIQKYISLIVEAYTLEQSIQMNPVNIVTDIPRLQALYDEIKALVATKQAQAEDMLASQASNQAMLIAQVVPPPVVILPPPVVNTIYDITLPTGNGRPTSPPYTTGDHIYSLVSNPALFMVSRKETTGVSFGIWNYVGDVGDTAPVIVPPTNDPYAQPYATAAQAQSQGRPGDKVYDTHQGDFRLVYGGAGATVNPAWTLVVTLP
jgi:hypothetical protein